MSRRLKHALLSRAARPFRRPALTPEALLTLTPERILIVRQQDQMGDVICSTPAIRAVREKWPAARIALVAASAHAGVFRHNPHIDELILFDKRGLRRPLALVRLLRTLRAFDPELALVLNTVSFSLTSALIGLASGARFLVGGNSAPFGSDFAPSVYSLTLPARPDLDRNAVLHALWPLQSVGIDTNNLRTVLEPGLEERRQAARLFAELGIEQPERVWAMHPGARKPQNLWPTERFAEVAACAARAGNPVLVLQGPHEQDIITAFRRELGRLLEHNPPARARVRVAPPVPIGVFAAILQQVERFLCNDTGVMHVAGAARVPTVALFGHTDPRLWKPPYAEVVAIRSPFRRDDPRGEQFGWLEQIEPEAVWRAWCTLDQPGGAEVSAT